ncbi:MAG TPA: hypothetical protein DHU59_02655, partial [Clostridiales bacterium]|nr:hypothetical protein [Clostridiales bacterium]
MKKKIYKIISLVFAILFILISPIGSYYNSKQSVAYAFEAVIDDATSKYVLPVAAYMLLRMQHELEGLGNTATVTINAVQQKIDELSANSAALMRSIPKQSKAIIAKVFTDMTTEQINTALGTTYTDLELDSLSAEVRSQRQSGTLGSTYKNIYDLGIAHIFASSVKLLSNNAFDKSLGIPVYDYLGESYRNVVVGSYEFRTKQHYFNYEFLNSLGPVLLTGYFTSGVRPDKSFVSNQIIQFGLYRIRFHVGSEVVWPTSNSDYSVADDAGVIDNFEFLSSRSYQEDYIFIEYLENSTWTILKQYISSSSLFLDSITAKSFLDDLFIFTGKDLSSLFFYSDSYFINDLMNFLYQGEFVLNPAGTLSIPLNIPALDSGFWGEDVSETPAERVTGAIGISSATWDVDVGTNTRANDDPDTNEDIPYVTDVVISPSTDLDVPDVDTGNPSFPEEGGDVGNPDDTSGILGWLKG